MINIYEAVDTNKQKSLLIIALFIGFVVLVSYVLANALGFGLEFVGVALIFSGLMSFASYYWSDKIILSISSAKEVDLKVHKDLYSVVQNLSIASGLPMPKVYIIDDTAPNAFATGRDPSHGIICITTGLLQKLDRTELEGVIGHELSHIGNYDTRLLAIVTILVGLVALLADWFLRASWGGFDDREDRKGGGAIIVVLAIIVAILSPILAQLMQLAISRRRELLADASSVKLTRQPSGLISALKKISHDKEPLEAANRATASLYIVNPLKGEEFKSKLLNLWNTHPPIEERIKLLEEMA